MSEKGATNRRHWVLGAFFITAFLLVSVVSTMFVWPRIIAKRVQTFCDTVAIGDEFGSLSGRAQASRLKVEVTLPFTTDKSKPETVLSSSDGLGFDHYFCTIEALGGKVTSKRFSHVN